jgi:hypothetical protein
MLTEIGGGGFPPPQPKLLTATTKAISVAISDMRYFDLMATSSSDYPTSPQATDFVPAPAGSSFEDCRRTNYQDSGLLPA